jgi:hypothetical protein
MTITSIPLEDDDAGYLFVEISDPQFTPSLNTARPETGPPGFEQTGMAENLASAVMLKTMPLLRGTLRTLSKNIRAGFADTPPETWQVELSIGFQGALAIPVLLKDGAQAALKITATWKKTPE